MLHKIITIPFYKTLLALRSLLFRLGFRRRYLVFGPRLDDKIAQKLFDDLPTAAKLCIINDYRRHTDVQSLPPIPVFLHIAKCGGTSIIRQLEKNAPPNYNLYWTNERPAEGYDNEHYRYGLQNPNINVMFGHFDIRLVDLIDRPKVVFTFLRDPLDRVLSHFHYMQELDDKSYMRDSGLALDEFLDTDDADYELKNFQVRVLCGKPYGPLDRTDLETAKRNLETKFDLIGTTQTIDEDIHDLQKIMGWPTDEIGRFNKTQSRPLSDEISPALRSKIEAYNALDIELFQYAMTLRQKRKKQGQV